MNERDQSRQYEQVIALSVISGSRFGRDGEYDFLQYPSLWNGVPSVVDIEEAGTELQWRLLIDSARQFTAEENARFILGIHRKKHEILTYVAEHALPESIFSGKTEIQDDYVRDLMGQFHKNALLFAHGNMRLLRYAGSGIAAWNTIDSDTRCHMYVAGYEALVVSAKRFDPWYDMEEAQVGEEYFVRKFSTYAVKVVRGVMLRALNAQSLLSLPNAGQDRVRKFFHVQERLSEHLGRPVDVDDLVVATLFREAHGYLPNEQQLETERIDRISRGQYSKVKQRIQQLIHAYAPLSLDEEREYSPKTQ